MRSLSRAALLAFAGTLALSALAALAAQPPGPLQPPANSPRRADPSWHALINATVHVSPTQTLEHATVVVRDGRIVSVTAGPKDGPAPAAPDGARTADCTGLHIYPGFIEPYLEVDAARPDLDAKGVHWNARVTPQRDPLSGKGVTEDSAKSLRTMGFVAAAVAPRGGIFRGFSSVVSLAKAEGDASQARPPVYAERVYQSVSMEGDGGSDAGPERWPSYPGSQMGAIALIRQTLIDADWEESKRRGKTAAEPTALSPLFRGPLVDGWRNGPGPTLLMNAEDELEVLRVRAIGAEFGRPVVVLASGTEYQRLDAVTADKSPLIVPLNFPKKPKVDSIGDAEGVNLRELMAWEQAPSNPRRLHGAGATVALTTAKLRDKGQFKENLRQAIRAGLSEEAALAMLTTVPAKVLGIDGQVGTIEAGKRAGLIVADGPIFAKKTKIRDVYIDGKRHEVVAAPQKLEGTYDVILTPPPAKPGAISWVIDKDGGLTIKKDEEPKAEDEKKEPAAEAAPAKANEPAKPDEPAKPEPAAKPEAKPETAAAPEAKAAPEPAKKPAKKTVEARAKSVVIAGTRLSFTFEHEPFGQPGVFTIAGVADETTKTITGVGTRADGARFAFSARRRESEPTLTGSWALATLDGAPPEKGGEISATIDREKNVTIKSKTASVKATDVKIEGTVLTFKLDATILGGPKDVTVEATLNKDTLTGTATDPDGTKHPFALTRREDDEDESPSTIPDKLPGLPFGPFAVETPAPQENIVITGATVWTSSDRGIINDGVVVIEKGTISFVGSADDLMSAGRKLDGYRNIDARGKHVTPGLIDCHSHTGISKGVNEGGQAVTAEVRIGDVTDPDSMSWYRQLAGGITTVNNLHGSANTIGGQNQVNKNRWGATLPSDLHFEGAISGIKFALGENVKGSNGQGSWRYPQTRMGVEALLRDRFIAAKEYLAARKTYTEAVGRIRSAAYGPQVQAERIAALDEPRRDLELEALAEVLEGKRLVHCHSYRQDEILMLARVAQDFGFKIGTYQHILEGYKVADVVRDFSGGGSCFSDWWAYKVEVQDAIPQGGPIMHEQGVVVSFNSDSDEMARRMNVEAAKAVKYSGGSIGPAEALKFVTINPARQLRIEARVGSLEPGKDADVVIWSGDPLSAFSKAEQTFIDGRLAFSLERDAALRETNAKERVRLVQKILSDKKAKPADADADKKPAAPDAAPEGRPGRRRPPQTLIERMLADADAQRRETFLRFLQRGIDPTSARSGVCGCD